MRFLCRIGLHNDHYVRDEKLFTLEEALWGVEGIQSASDLPVVVSFSFDQGTRTMMGTSPAEVAPEHDASAAFAIPSYAVTLAFALLVADAHALITACRAFDLCRERQFSFL